ncbi:hypothetical protein ACQ86N_24430 [Puia sp. P3]|uniref:hypothetical protein n=1 Tax=Puia sp. P3 TaxID=3423952 RepID=UPI003D66D668
MPVDKMVHGLGVVAAEYLLEVILAYVSISFKVLHQKIDFFFCCLHLFGRTA